jgi:hypothetical protein
MAVGGKRPGAGRKKAPHTLQAEKAKALLVAEYLKHAKPIIAALIKRATKGDIQAIKELHDRVYGRPVQPLAGDPENPLKLQITGMKISNA